MRQYTNEEVRDRFLDHVRDLVRYWSKTEGSERAKLEGIAFSIMAALDGSATALPGFVVAPNPHPDDKQFGIDNGENYYPEAPEVECDIAGSLHELIWRPQPGADK